MDIHQHPDARGVSGPARGCHLPKCGSDKGKGERSVPGASSKAGHCRDGGVLVILNLFFVPFVNSQAQGGEPVLAGIMINLCPSLSVRSLYGK